MSLCELKMFNELNIWIRTILMHTINEQTEKYRAENFNVTQTQQSTAKQLPNTSGKQFYSF